MGDKVPTASKHKEKKNKKNKENMSVCVGVWVYGPRGKHTHTIDCVCVAPMAGKGRSRLTGSLPIGQFYFSQSSLKGMSLTSIHFKYFQSHKAQSPRAVFVGHYQPVRPSVSLDSGQVNVKKGRKRTRQPFC
jgi:hypothetical protein